MVFRGRASATGRGTASGSQQCGGNHSAATVDLELNTYAWSTTLRLADQFRLTVYDAVYLELAQRRALPLATLDQELRTAAQGLGLTVAQV